MRTTRRQCLQALAGSMSAPGGPRGRAGVAFHYQANFGPRALDWYTRFEILVTGGVLARQQTETLRARGPKLVAYEWSSAFYPDDPVSAAPAWQQRVRTNGRQWLLSEVPAGGGAAAPGRRALWYDFGNPALVDARADYLAGLLRSSGYGGWFFDTLGFEQLPPPMRSAFGRRNPGQDYNRCQGRLLEGLRRRLGPESLIFSNQGYRHAECFLPYADLDLTESYFTAVDAGATRFRPWHDPRKPWESIRTPMEELVVAAARRYPSVRFVHLNYAAGDEGMVRRAVRYSYACARLWGHESYLTAPAGFTHEEDDVYFSDLGDPLGATYEENRTAGVAWRLYQRGLVAINTGSASARIPSLGIALPDPPRGYVFGG
ncbi:MAG: hypothetical protein HY822_18750 [Acidobacteria bacterium]|nr:hypothetical protein [Acidobacteriota bacterium]